MRQTISIFILLILFASCKGTRSSKGQMERAVNPDQAATDIFVGGPCDRCDVIYEGIPSADNIGSSATIAATSEPGEKMELTGTVFRQDGKTPAENIILYLYHTNAEGYYAPSDTQTVGRINGRLRGWIKTSEQGRFSIHSIRPAPYPDRNIPAHIHILVKEPGKTRYFIDEVWFDDDSLISSKMRADAEKRGGDQIIHVVKDGSNTWRGELKIVLGLNIPGYK